MNFIIMIQSMRGSISGGKTNVKPFVECMISTDTVLAGYPHIHYYGNEKIPENFSGTMQKMGTREKS